MGTLRTIVQRSPMLVSSDRLGELTRDYGDWAKKAEGGYLLWIEADVHNRPYATPEEQGQVARLQPVFKDDTASGYAILQPEP